MFKNSYLFQARWLWKKNDTIAMCNYCSKETSVASMEEAALTSYMKDKKHTERPPSDQCIKSLVRPTPASSLIILKKKLSGGWS